VYSRRCRHIPQCHGQLSPYRWLPVRCHLPAVTWHATLPVCTTIIHTYTETLCGTGNMSRCCPVRVGGCWSSHWTGSSPLLLVLPRLASSDAVDVRHVAVDISTVGAVPRGSMNTIPRQQTSDGFVLLAEQALSVRAPEPTAALSQPTAASASVCPWMDSRWISIIERLCDDELLLDGPCQTPLPLSLAVILPTTKCLCVHACCLSPARVKTSQDCGTLAMLH
jgi:hypothetical protein